MSNSLSASFAKYWSKRMQIKHYKTDVYRAFVSMEEQDTLKKGDTVHRPYRSALSVNDLGSEGQYTRQDITDTDETLAINKEKEVTFYIREIDEMQSNYKTANDYADDAAVALGNQIDGDVLGEVLNAGNTVDDGSIGGTSGNGITASTTNLDKIFGKAAEKLDAADIKQDSRVAIISPQLYNVIWQRIGGKATVLGDKTLMNGNEGDFANFALHKSNNLTWTGVLALATAPTDGDTVTMRGVTFTFKTTLGSTAGNVLIGANVTASKTNLAALVNTPGTTTSTGVALSTANQKLLKNFSAALVTGGVKITALGVSYVVVSETLTDATDTWTAALQIQHNLFCRKGCTDLVIQKMPTMTDKSRDGYLGRDIVSYTVYGKKTFLEGVSAMVDVQIRSDAF